MLPHSSTQATSVPFGLFHVDILKSLSFSTKERCLWWLMLRRTLWDREVGMGWEICRALPSPAEGPGCRAELDTSSLPRLPFCSLRFCYLNSFALLSDQRGGLITQLITHQKSLNTRKDNPIKWFCPEIDFQPNLAIFIQTYFLENGSAAR